MIKPGYKTSEFWFTLVSFIFSGLFLIGVISDNGHKEDLIRDVSHGVESIILIGGQLILLFKYINGRKQIKETFYQNNGPAIEKQPKPVKKTTKKRTTKKQPSTKTK